MGRRGGSKVLGRRLKEVHVVAEFLVEHKATLEFLLDGAGLPRRAHLLAVGVVLIKGKRVQELPVGEG